MGQGDVQWAKGTCSGPRRHAVGQGDSQIEPHGVYILNSECTLFELRADSDQSSSFIIIIIHHVLYLNSEQIQINHHHSSSSTFIMHHVSCVMHHV